MNLKLPKVLRLILQDQGNEIWQYFGNESILKNIQVISINPFIINSDDKNYLLTSKEDDPNIGDHEYVLLTTKKPTRKDLQDDKIKFRRWINSPLFKQNTPAEITSTWKDNFKFVKEDESKNIKGLRPPQIGALYSILAHMQNPEDKSIVVMPTGTGKTETMLATLIANCCTRLLVSVPSDSLRTQIAEKFISLGLLREFNLVDEQCINPIVGIVNHGFSSSNELKDFITKCNVVVSTMKLLVDAPIEQKTLLNKSFSHFFVDEAHHSEAATWKKLIERFDKEKVTLFTATPFRNDGKNLQGKIISQFSLKKAQEQKYYKTINYLPIREYNKELADKKIAKKAIEQLQADIANGYKHILMARCVSKNRAREVFQYYCNYPEYNPVLIYTGVAGIKEKFEAIKRGEHSIIVCVNMLGEGFDLPSLKIAAIHDERQSLPVTLQFIGRFTRTSYEELGNASFITNTAYPPIHAELDQLYARNADWNLLLPRLSANATQKEIDIKEFLDGFSGLNNSNIPFSEINPALSTIIYKTNVTSWKPTKQYWEKHFSSYDHVFSDTNHSNTIVIILGKLEKIDWGNFEGVQNLKWDSIIIHWDLRPDVNRVYLNTSLKQYSGKDLLEDIFGKDKLSLITGMNVFRIFNNVNRLSLFNVGTRPGIGKDISFQSYFGKGVQDGIKLLEQGTLIKNNIFGVGYKEGEKISLGCSVKGKIWSYQRGNLHELTNWCKEIGDIVEDENIDSNVVLQHTLAVEKLSQRPINVMPILIDWNPEMYEHLERRYNVVINGRTYNLSNVELNIHNPSLDEPLQFSVDTNEYSVKFQINLGTNPNTNESFYEVKQLSGDSCSIIYGNSSPSLVRFFQDSIPTIWFADGSQLFGNLYVKLKNQPDIISKESIIIDNWTGVDIKKESQDIAPYIKDSIQYYFIDKIKNDFDIIYDDDGKGEIADIIGVNDKEDTIEVHLYHLKYALNGAVSNNINNFYQVCGQALKALKWKHKDGREIFTHLFKRKDKILNGNTCSRIIKGSEEDLENLLEQAKWTKAIRYHMYIVQPALSKEKASNDILLLLGNIQHCLATIGNIDLKVYSSH